MCSGFFWWVRTFFILYTAFNLSMCHIFKMKQQNKATDVTHCPKPWFVTCGNFTDYMLSHAYLSTLSFTRSIFFFLLCFKINFIDIKFRHDKLYPFNMYSLWALTDVHTCEIKIQNVFTIFKRLCPCCRPCLLGSWPQASTPCFVSLFSPLLEVHLNAFTFYVAFCVWFCT